MRRPVSDGNWLQTKINIALVGAARCSDKTANNAVHCSGLQLNINTQLFVLKFHEMSVRQQGASQQQTEIKYCVSRNDRSRSADSVRSHEEVLAPGNPEMQLPSAKIIKFNISDAPSQI